MISVMDEMVDPTNGLKLAERPKALADRLGGIWSMVSEVSDNLPPATLRWRIQNWLAVGQGRVEKDLPTMKVPVVIIAGSADRLLPSPEEAARLKKIIPGCRTMLLEGHGHAPLFDGRVDLSEIIASDPAMKDVKMPEKVMGGAKEEEGRSLEQYSAIFAKDWVEDFEVPTEAVVDEGRKTIDFLLKSVSPVFFSTQEDGSTVSGLSAVPGPDKSRPILFVGNHQLMALDLGVIVERLYAEKGVLARGLAHPMVFMGQTTPRALDGTVSGVIRESEHTETGVAGQHKHPASEAATTTASEAVPGNPSRAGAKPSSGEAKGKVAEDGSKKKDENANGMMNFFSKVRSVVQRV
ncbi:unnamed protein product [Sphacelaria rigidula]